MLETSEGLLSMEKEEREGPLPVDTTAGSPSAEVVEESQGIDSKSDEEDVDGSIHIDDLPTAEPIVESPEEQAGVAEDDDDAPLEVHEFSTGETINLDDIASFLDVAVDSLESIDVLLLQKLSLKSTEFANLQSDKLVLEVNLEQASHLNNKKVDMFKNQLTKTKAQNKELTERNSLLESTNQELYDKVSNSEANVRATSSLADQLKAKVEELTTDQRRNLEIIEKKNKEIDSIRSQYNGLQDSNSDLRKRLIEVETSSQSVLSNLNHGKVKIQSLENQLELVNKNYEWSNNELQRITQEFSSYRKDKSIEITKLQSESDKAQTDLSGLTLRYNNLNTRYDELRKKLDDSLVQVNTLSDAKTINEEEFLKEMSVKDRLVNLLQKANEDSKTKIEHLESRLHLSRSDVAGESAVLQTTIDSYKQKLAESEQKIDQLEKTIDELSKVSSSLDSNSSVVSIPALSPSARATSKSAGLSLSQLYADFTLVKRQLIQERRAKERMQQQMDDFVLELEQKAPIITATRERASLLENELTELSVILENTSKEKDALQKNEKDLRNSLKESQVHINVLNKQRIDLARQVQQLLIQVTIRNDSGGPLTPAEQDAIERISKGEKVINDTDTDKLISQRLVTFKNVVELQTKNEELLRIIRELGSKLEQEEQTSKSKLENLESVAINEAKEAILTLQDEIGSLDAKLNAVTRERDIFRSLLSNKSTSNNILGSDLTGANDEQVAELTKKYQELEKELKHTTDQLNTVKIESEAMVNMLNKQIASLSEKRSSLAVELAREKSSNTLVEERYKSLQENFNYAKSEIEELRRTSQFLQDSLAKQDLRTQNVAEELVQAKYSVESLRSETSNLKAEKQLWKNVEKRLSDENASLIEEKTKLNSLLISLQSIDKEREATSAESQKRLVVQSESLERELRDVRSKLTETSAELKDTLTRKEADGQAYQERIDSLRTQISSTKEELITKSASVEQLNHKVNTLSVKLAAAEAHLKEYQSLTEGSSNTESEALKLRIELDETKAELDAALTSIEEFKNIANASEEALKNMNISFDGYKESMTSETNKLKKENDDLNERAILLNEQIETLNTELSSQKSSLQKEIEDAQKEIELLRLQVTESDKLKSDYDAKVALIDSSYQQQVDLANQAQQNYLKELQKHAEASKAFSALREETNAFKQQISELSSELKQAQEHLSKSEESWETQKSQLEEELKISTARAQDLASQNHILFNEIEKLTKRKDSGAVSESGLEGATEELRELVNLLRHEKEISDTQLDVSTRDLKRVRQQLELVTAELDKSRLELVNYQSRQTDLNRLSSEHQKLLDEIQQLNLLRESNTTLRNELHSKMDRVKELEDKLTECESKLQPLEGNVSQLQTDIKHKEQEVKLVTEERDRWRQKSMDIINKYDRIDPEEYGKLKESVQTLEKEKEQIQKALEESTNTVNELTPKFDRVRKEAVEKLKKKDVEIKTAHEQVTAAQQQLENLKTQTHKEIESLKTKVKELESKAQHADSNDQGDLKKELESLKAELAKKASAASRVQELESSLKSADEVKRVLESQVSELESQVTLLKKTSKVTPDTSKLDETVEKLQNDISDLQSKKADLESAISKESAVVTTIDEKSLKEVLKKQEEELKAKFEVETKARVEKALENLKARIRAPSEAKLQELAKNKTKSLEDDYNKRVQLLKTDYEAKLAANASGSSENANIVSDYESKLANLREELKAKEAQALEEGRKLGREATLKETNMRSKLLQNKLDKLLTENKDLKAKLESSASNPAKPVEIGQKRPAEEGGDQPQDKKSKNSS